MNTFKINRDSWHYKLNKHFFNEYNMWQWEAKHNNFCAYWRAPAIRRVFASLAIAFVMVQIAALATIVWRDPIGFVLGFATIVGGLAAFLGLITAILRARKKASRARSKSAAPRTRLGEDQVSVVEEQVLPCCQV